MFSDLLEAVSRSHCTVQVWLEQYRELMLHVNRATSREEQDNTSNIVAPQQIMNWKVLVQGRAGKLATDSVAARANQYWASAVRNWTRISGVSLDSATMQIIQLAKSSPFKTLHLVYDPETKKIVQGELVKKLPPENAQKNVL